MSHRQDGIANADLGRLLTQASEGSLAAFGSVFDLTYRQATVLVRAVGCEDADPVLEHCYRDIWSRLPEFATQELSGSAWLMGVVYRYARTDSGGRGDDRGSGADRD